VTAHRTREDCAHHRRGLVEARYPEAEGIRAILESLTTHKPASLYATCPPAEARRLLKKLECHSTPKHGSGRNLAAIAWSILQRQGVDRRIPDETPLVRETQAYAAARNAAKATLGWRFTTTDAREKLQHLYPSHSK
jgi:hypothetical protein